jgi:hypothetical protein
LKAVVLPVEAVEPLMVWLWDEPASDVPFTAWVWFAEMPEVGD